MSKQTKVFVYVVVAVVVVLLVYAFADSRGYRAGMLQGAVVKTIMKNKAAQTKAQQAKALQKKAAGTAAAKEVNTFKVVNPLQNINIRPDQKTIDTLNPFK